MQDISWLHNYSVFQPLPRMKKFGEEEETLQKVEYCESKNSFLGEIKSNLYILYRHSFVETLKKWWISHLMYAVS